MKNIFFLPLFICTVVAAVLSVSCGGSGGSGSSAPAGSVVLYATDSPEDDYSEVTMTLNSVELLHTGSGDTCTLMELDEPEELDITELASKLYLIDVSTCDAGTYNRVHIEFGRTVTLTDTGGATADCRFTSYKSDNNKPNVLHCEGEVCALDINGAVNVVSKEYTPVALDFELKEFEVEDFPAANCPVTIKVSPLNASGIEKKHDNGYDEGISGKIKELDMEGKLFILSSKGGRYAVSYGGITTQPGIDDLLELAFSDGLEVSVESTAIDPEGGSIDASAVHVDVEGTVSDLDTLNETFVLTYGAEGSIAVSYLGAETEGTLAPEAAVEVELDGYNGSEYLAREVEVDD